MLLFIYSINWLPSRKPVQEIYLLTPFKNRKKRRGHLGESVYSAYNSDLGSDHDLRLVGYSLVFGSTFIRESACVSIPVPLSLPTLTYSLSLSNK